MTTELAGLLNLLGGLLEDSMISDESYRVRKLDEGLRFQEFACRVLADNGISTIPCYSPELQSVGDTTGGFEVKYNSGIDRTGHIVLETHEKQKGATEWVPSGLSRQDDSWAWVMGDYERLVLWSKRRLVLAVKSGKLGQYETETSKGYTMKWEMARNGADKILLDNPGGSGK